MRSELLTLSRDVADLVARHLVAAGQIIDEDPDLALAHAVAARRLASRIAVVREAVGLAAYAAGDWATAIAELRTYHRMTGRQTHLAEIADSERALGRPERAIDLYRGADLNALDKAGAIELLIVAAGARGDLGQHDAAVSMLDVPELTAYEDSDWAARLRYAYADALLAAGRREDAREWFSRTAAIDHDDTTDAAERLLELDGITIEDDVDEDQSADTDDEHIAGTDDESSAGMRERSASDQPTGTDDQAASATDQASDTDELGTGTNAEDRPVGAADQGAGMGRPDARMDAEDRLAGAADQGAAMDEPNARAAAEDGADQGVRIDLPDARTDAEDRSVGAADQDAAMVQPGARTDAEDEAPGAEIRAADADAARGAAKAELAGDDPADQEWSEEHNFTARTRALSFMDGASIGGVAGDRLAEDVDGGIDDPAEDPAPSDVDGDGLDETGPAIEDDEKAEVADELEAGAGENRHRA